MIIYDMTFHDFDTPRDCIFGFFFLHNPNLRRRNWKWKETWRIEQDEVRALSDKLQSSEKEIFLFSLAVNLDVGEFKKISNKRIPHKCIRTISPNALQNVLKIPFTPSSHRLEWLSSGDRGKTGDWQIFIQTIHNSSICSVDKSSTWEIEQKRQEQIIYWNPKSLFRQPVSNWLGIDLCTTLSSATHTTLKWNLKCSPSLDPAQSRLKGPGCHS